MTTTHAKDAFAEAFDYAAEELDGFLTRILAAHRTIRAVQCPNGLWCAISDDDRMYFPPSPRETTFRFVHAFTKRHHDFEALTPIPHGFSIKVPGEPTGGREPAATTSAASEPSVSQAAAPTAEPASPDNIIPFPVRA